MATKRKSLSKKTRFEVFKRDGFKCQYCGASAPEAILVVDHIDPISKDGSDDMMNYITACQPCNAGKSDRKLDDNSVIQKQKAQLDELNERREQLEMMLQWRDSMRDILGAQIDAAHDLWRDCATGWHLNENGLTELKKLLKKYGVQVVLDAIESVRDAYMKSDSDGKLTAESVRLAWSKVGGFCRMNSMEEGMRELYYIKGILRNRFNYVPYDVMKYLEAAFNAGVDVDDIKMEAKHSRNWTAFSQWLAASMEGA